MSFKTYRNIDFDTNAGTFQEDIAFLDVLVLNPDTNPITITEDLVLELVMDDNGSPIALTPRPGMTFAVTWEGGIVLGGKKATLNGIDMTAAQMLAEGTIVFSFINDEWQYLYLPNLRMENVLSGAVLLGNTVDLIKISKGASGQMPVVASNGNLTYRSLTGDVAIDDTGLTALKATFRETIVVSFDASTEMGDLKIPMPKCSVTGFYACVSKTVEATNAATITPKNNAGTPMTSGGLTITGGSTVGATFTSTPSAENVFTEGQIMTLSIAKANAGGKVLLTYTIQRT